LCDWSVAIIEMHWVLLDWKVVSFRLGAQEASSSSNKYRPDTVLRHHT
jgi:hypothetical protein